MRQQNALGSPGCVYQRCRYEQLRYFWQLLRAALWD